MPKFLRFSCFLSYFFPINLFTRKTTKQTKEAIANTVTIKVQGDEDGELSLSGVKNNNPPNTKVATIETMILFIEFIRFLLVINFFIIALS
jgi:hypothetical protein